MLYIYIYIYRVECSSQDMLNETRDPDARILRARPYINL